MRAILSLSVVCLLTAAWTLVILWMTGVLLVEEVRADLQSPTAQSPAALAPTALGVALPTEESPADDRLSVTVVQVTRGGRNASPGQASPAEDGARVEGPRVLESVAAAESSEASAPAKVAAPKKNSAEKPAGKNSGSKNPAGKKSAGKNAGAKNKRKRPKKPNAAKPPVSATAEAPAAALLEAEPEVEAVLCACAGRVLTADGLPLAGYLVELDLGAEVLRATTDELGEFILGAGASAPEGLVSARVREPAGDLVHFSELLAGGDVELLVRSVEQLSGRLETQPPADYASLEVAVILPAMEGLHSDLLLGSTTLDAEGRFMLEGIEPSATDAYRLRFHHGNATLAVAEVSRDQLLEGEASIQFDLARLDLRVRDLAGVPIPQARVRLVRFDTEGCVESATSGTILCDAEGRAWAELRTGSWELSVSAPGHAPQTLEANLASNEIASRIDTTLYRLGAQDLVRGEVLSADGKPVTGALVTARPPSRCRDLSSHIATTTRTDKRGRFELSLDLDALTILEAEHPLHGRIEQPAIAPGFRVASLRFQPRHALKVGLTLDEPGGPPLEGQVQYALIDAEGNLSASGLGESPLILRGLKAGEYELFAVSQDGTAGARGPVQVTAPNRGTPARGALFLKPWPTTLGVISTPEGTPLPGLMIIAEMPNWPAAIVFEHARTVSDDSGRFQLRLPVAESRPVHAQDGSRVVSSGTIESGVKCVLTVQ